MHSVLLHSVGFVKHPFSVTFTSSGKGTKRGDYLVAAVAFGRAKCTQNERPRIQESSLKKEPFDTPLSTSTLSKRLEKLAKIPLFPSDCKLCGLNIWQF